jgi:cytochrome c oxidase cbb3-type subunit 4
MDLNFLREASMLIGLVVFLGIVWWAYGPSRRARFEADARLVLDEPERSVVCKGERT